MNFTKQIIFTKMMQQGSGGNYLSNQIFYRVALAREDWITKNPGALFPSGHFHVAFIQKNDLNSFYETTGYLVFRELVRLIGTVQQQIISGFQAIGNRFINHPNPS